MQWAPGVGDPGRKNVFALQKIISKKILSLKKKQYFNDNPEEIRGQLRETERRGTRSKPNKTQHVGGEEGGR